MKTHILFFIALSFYLSTTAQSIDSIAVEICTFHISPDPDQFTSQQIDSISQGLKRQSLIRQWSSSNQWVNSSLITYTYDNNLRNDSILTQHWNGSTWADDSLIIKSYDAAGNMLSYTHQLAFRYLYFYDANNNDTLIQYQTWNSGWQNATQWKKSYDAFNKIILNINQSWLNLVWNNVTKEEFNYNPNHHLIQRFVYDWDSGNSIWKNSLQFNYYQDAFENDTSIIHESWQISTWVQTEKDSFVYDVWNHPSLYARYFFDGTVWNKDFEQEVAYDSVGHFLGSYTHCCGGASETTISYTYNSDGSVTDESIYQITQGGTQSYRNCHYYSLDYPNNSQIYIFGATDLVKCSKDTVHIGLFSLGGYQPIHFHWAPASDLSSDTIENPLLFCDTARIYQLNIIDSLGHTAYKSIVVTVKPSPDVTVTRTCNTLFAYPSQSVSWYKWYKNGSQISGATTNSYHVTSYGTFYVQVRSTNQCIASSANEVINSYNSINGVVNVSYGCIPGCNGEAAATVTLGIHPYGYSWSNGSIDSTLYNLCDGTYSVEMTESGGCQKLLNVVINSPSVLAMNTNATATTCSGCLDGTITGTSSGGSGPFTYTLNPSGTSNSSGIFTGLPAGNYQLCVTDANNCAICDTVTVLEDPTGISYQSKVEMVRIYPNPFTDESILEVSQELLLLNPEFIILDLLGNEISGFAVQHLQTIIDRKTMSAGVYFYKVKTLDMTIANGKVVIVD